MDDIRRINEQLAKYPREIYIASMKTEELREAWMLAEARMDYEVAGAYMKAKAENFTDGVAKARATDATYETAKEVIIAESVFRRAEADQKRVENEFTAVRKQANLLETSIQNSGRI